MQTIIIGFGTYIMFKINDLVHSITHALVKHLTVLKNMQKKKKQKRASRQQELACMRGLIVKAKMSKIDLT